MKINTNAIVYVKLTQFGLERLYKYFDDLYTNIMYGNSLSMKAIEQKVEETIATYKSGTFYHKFPLWELMNIFGPVMYIGMPQVPFENNEIKLNEEDSND